jgi:hypothetical protein
MILVVRDYNKAADTCGERLQIAFAVPSLNKSVIAKSAVVNAAMSGSNC